MAINYKVHHNGNNMCLGLNEFSPQSTIKTKDNTFLEFQYFGMNGSPNYYNSYFIKYNDDKTLSNTGKWFTKSEL